MEIEYHDSTYCRICFECENDSERELVRNVYLNWIKSNSDEIELLKLINKELKKE